MPEVRPLLPAPEAPNDLDIIAALQHRNRLNVHDVKGVQAHLSYLATLIERDGVRDVEKLVRQLRHYEHCLGLVVEKMQSDVED